MTRFIILNAIDGILTVIGVFGMGLTEMNPIAQKLFTHTGAWGPCIHKLISVGLVIKMLRQVPATISVRVIKILNFILTLTCIWNIAQILMIRK